MISFKKKMHYHYIVPLILISTFEFILPVYSELELPKIPERPTLVELKKSLRADLNEKKSNKKYDYYLEKLLPLDHERLFSRSLEIIKSLKLSLKSFDVSSGEIIAQDCLRNKIIIQVISNGKVNSNKVQITGYSSKIGKSTLHKNIEKIALALNIKQ